MRRELQVFLPVMAVLFGVGLGCTPQEKRLPNYGFEASAGRLPTKGEPAWPSVALDNSVYQPPYLGNAWGETLGVAMTTDGRTASFTWTDGTPVELTFPFRIHVRSVSGSWEADCEATWRSGYPGFLLLGAADADRAGIPRGKDAWTRKVMVGSNTCTLESVGEVEVTIPGTPVTARGPAGVLVGKE